MCRQQHGVADVHMGPPLDLASLDSVRRFAAAWDAAGRPLHILVNNAGANYVKEAYTADGVAVLAQVRNSGLCHQQPSKYYAVLRWDTCRVRALSCVRAGQLPGTVRSHAVPRAYAPAQRSSPRRECVLR